MNAPFFNRSDEMSFLHKKFRSKQPELLIFRGRRRVGKTFLLREFSRQVDGLYLLATVTSVLFANPFPSRHAARGNF